MKIILKRDHAPLGDAGQVVNVSNGFARNYLIPRGIAIQATPSALRQFEFMHRAETKRLDKEKQEAQRHADALNGISVTVPVSVGEEHRVFGSVTAQDIADKLAEQEIAVDRRKIILDEPIKALGVYDIPIKIYQDVTATVKLWVVKE